MVNGKLTNEPFRLIDFHLPRASSSTKYRIYSLVFTCSPRDLRSIEETQYRTILLQCNAAAGRISIVYILVNALNSTSTQLRNLNAFNATKLLYFD